MQKWLGTLMLLGVGMEMDLGLSFAAAAQPPGPEAGSITTCTPNPQRAAITEPYDGYQATGYKGSMEPDKAWFAAVKTVSLPNGGKRFVLRKAPAKPQIAFESIETLALGGKAVGFIAYRQGCGELLDAKGQSLGVPAFDALQADLPSRDLPHSVLLKRTVVVAKPGAEPETANSYVRFTRGKLVASSPHQYLLGDGLASISSANSELDASNLRAVHISEPVGAGILDLASLHELLQPRWSGVGQVINALGKVDKNGQLTPRFLLAMDSQGLHLHTAQGQPIALPRFDHIEMWPNWLPSPAGNGNGNGKRKAPDNPPLLIQTQELKADKTPQSCRLYNEALQPLVDEPVPASYCPRRSGRDSPYFAYSTAAGTQVFLKQRSDQLLTLQRVGRNIKGKLIYPLDSGALLLESGEQTSQPTYRLVTPQGADIAERSFDTAELIGGGQIVVTRGKQRWMLRQDGSLSTTMTRPFS